MSTHTPTRSLGRPVAHFQTAPMTTALAFLALALGPYLMGTLLGWITGSDEVYTLVFILSAVAVGVWVFRVTRRRVLVHQKGLYFAARFVERRIRWDTVKVVEGDFTPSRLTNPQGDLRFIRLEDEAGKSLTILRFRKGTRDLFSAIESATHTHILNRCKTKFKNEASIHFGADLTLTQDEIRLHESIISWDEIGEVRPETFSDGHLYIRLLNHIGDELLIIPAFGIPNIHVLEDFVRWVKKEHIK